MMHSGLYGKSHPVTFAEGKCYITLSNSGSHACIPGALRVSGRAACRLYAIWYHMPKTVTAARAVRGLPSQDQLTGLVVGLTGALGVTARHLLGQPGIAGLDGPDQLPVLVP